MQIAGIETSLPRNKPTILKDNISWHMPYLSFVPEDIQWETFVPKARMRVLNQKEIHPGVFAVIFLESSDE